MKWGQVGYRTMNAPVLLPVAPNFMLACRGGKHAFEDTWEFVGNVPEVLCRHCGVPLIPRYSNGRIIARTYTYLIEERP